MARSPDLYKAVFRNSGIAMAVLRHDGEIILSNPAFGDLVRNEGIATLPATLWEIVAADDLQQTRRRISTLQHPGERDSWPVTVGSSSRRENVWRLDVSVVASEEGRPVLLLNARDVTLQKRTEERLRSARDAAERATRTKSEFLANMSHEIRTPLHTITGMTELLLDTALDEEQHEYADQVLFSADVLLGLINGILDFSKIEAGKLVLESIPFSPAEVTEDAVDMLSLEAHRRGLEATIHCAAGLPEQVLGDPGRVRQIVINLFNNAVKFTEAGSVDVRIFAVSGPDRDTETVQTEGIATEACGTVVLRTEVRDTGVGIPEDRQARLFEAFAQADSSTTRLFGGTGLGLSICSSLVEMMGGSIGVESQVGSGSTFWFEIPYTVNAGVAKLPRTGHGRRVLVVDDSQTSREVLVDYLRRFGSTVETARDGQEGLAQLRRAVAEHKPFDLALVDLVLAGMDGWQVASEVNADQAICGTPLVLMSPTGKLAGEAKMKRLPWFREYISKPIRIRKLGAVLEGVLANAEVPDRDVAVDEEEAAEVMPVGSVRILVAEDHEVNQQLFETILERLGYEVEIAGNGREAVEIADRAPPDLAFMDVQMPEMNGDEATEAIRKHGHRFPIIAVTANALRSERERCTAAGMDDFLPKPFKRVDLLPLLDKWLGAAGGAATSTHGGEVRHDSSTERVRAAGSDLSGQVGTAVSPEAELGIPQHLFTHPLAGPDAPVFDHVVAVGRFLGDEVVVKRVVTEFLVKLEQSARQMSRDVELGSFADIEREAHGLKGGAWSLEAGRLGDAAAYLEAAAKMEDRARCQYYLKQLTDTIAEFAQACAPWLAEAGSE